jgi:serine/threonine protein kinase
MERAMKCTKLDSMTRDQRLREFLPLCEEALLSAELGAHPNIIALRCVISIWEEFLVIMDYVKGSKELDKCYKDNSLWNTVDGGRASWGSAPPTEKITAVLATLWHQLLNALGHLHSRKIMHSDVKPANIMLNASTLHLYLFDMGLAREGRLNQKGVLEFDLDGYTPEYAGPEAKCLFDQFEGSTVAERKVLQQENPIDASSLDLWGAALTIFELVWDCRVWESGDEGDVLAAYWGESVF